MADAEHAVASARRYSAATADDIDDGFSDDAAEARVETAVDIVESATEQGVDSTSIIVLRPANRSSLHLTGEFFPGAGASYD